MTITLGKNHRQDSQVTILATSGKKGEIVPGYFNEEALKAIAAWTDSHQSDKNTSEKIDAHSLTMVRGKTISHIILCPVGHQAWDDYHLNKWVVAVLAAAKKTSNKKVDIDLDSVASASKNTDIAQLTASLSQALLHHQYSFDRYKSDTGKSPVLSINLISASFDAASRHALNQVKAIHQGKVLARNLADMPANDCDVNHLVNVARELAKDSKTSLKVIDEKRMEKLGMGAFLAVTKGSSQEGKLLVLEYRGGTAKDPYHALIGKGLTFDTGGISLKPAAGMEEMKYDMCGAASVLGSCQAIINMKAKVNALFVVAAAENMPSGEATRPGDIVKTHEGLTVEILNTDAEGRLVLCDAISYIKKQYKPKTMVDIATLTGACVIALGHHASALYSNNTPLSNSLQKAATSSADRVWPMPMWQDYQDQLSSNIADLPNISGGRDAGSITAACFLSRFAKGTAWAHLDIAGTGWQSGKNKQATGRPTALLTHYLLQQK